MNDLPTDKYSTGLLDVYEKEFAPWRNAPVRVVELGVDQGGFTTWLERYFSKAEYIIGIDSNMHGGLKERGPVKFVNCLQDSVPGLIAIGGQYGKFDIIIDDCSHVLEPTLVSTKTLWPFLKSGGLYVIEDWAAGLSRGGPFEGLEGALYDLIEARVSKEIKIFDKVGPGGHGCTSIFVKQ